jgi:steroid delta-isomerase-like uncharacterized protein
MTREDITALFARRQEAWARRDAASLAADHIADGEVHSPLAGGTVHTRAEIEKLYQAYFVAFPDLVLQHEDVLIDGERVAVFARAAGTDRGGFMGLPPTGRAVKLSIAMIYHLRDGLIAREWRVYDFTGLLVQVGALKAKPI